MAKTSPTPPGTILRIPLSDGSFGCGRALSDPYIAFYSLRTQPSPNGDGADPWGSEVLLPPGSQVVFCPQLALSRSFIEVFPMRAVSVPHGRTWDAWCAAAP